MTDADLCARGLHPRPPGDVPCPKCNPPKEVCANGHDLTLPGATYVGANDGRARCAECRRRRKAKARAKARKRKRDRESRLRRKAEGPKPPPKAVEPPPKPVPFADLNAQVGPRTAALHRHALLIRRQRGLLP